MKGNVKSFPCLDKIALVPRLKLRLKFVLLVLQLLCLISGHYPNEIFFGLLNSNERMFSFGDIMLVVFVIPWRDYDK